MRFFVQILKIIVGLGDDHLLFSQNRVLWPDNEFSCKLQFSPWEGPDPSDKGWAGAKVIRLSPKMPYNIILDIAFDD